MITIRPSNARGYADHGWLKARHTFSFAEYLDDDYMGYSALRVINDDVIAPGRGFGMHPHRDMEIVTYVLRGALSHEDSMGNGSVIRAGDVQYMSAGRGVRHSEFNASESEEVRLLQIWIFPDQRGAEPRYDQASIPPAAKRGQWLSVVSPEGGDGVIRIRQDARMLATVLNGDAPLDYAIPPGRRVYVQMAGGEARLNGKVVRDGDGIFVENETVITLSEGRDAEVVLFDLP